MSKLIDNTKTFLPSTQSLAHIADAKSINQSIKVLLPQYARQNVQPLRKKAQAAKRVVEACQSKADLAWLHDLKNQDILSEQKIINNTLNEFQNNKHKIN